MDHITHDDDIKNWTPEQFVQGWEDHAAQKSSLLGPLYPQVCSASGVRDNSPKPTTCLVCLGKRP